MFAAVPDPKTPSRTIFVGLVSPHSDQALLPSDGTITNERVIKFIDGHYAHIRRSSLKQEDRIAKLTNLYFRNNHLSKEHAVIRYDENDGYFITDTNSTFGTVINGSKVLIPNVEFPLKNKDEVGFVMSKPSSQVKKAFRACTDFEKDLGTIPLEHFGNPQIEMQFVVEISDSILRFIPLNNTENKNKDESNQDLSANQSLIDSEDKTREIEEIPKSGTEDRTEDLSEDEIQILDGETVRAMEDISIEIGDKNMNDEALSSESFGADKQYKSNDETQSSFKVVDSDVYSEDDHENVHGDDDRIDTHSIPEVYCDGNKVESNNSTKSKGENYIAENDQGDWDTKDSQESSDEAPSEVDIVYDCLSEDDHPEFGVQFSNSRIYDDGEVEYDNYETYNDESCSVCSVDEFDNDESNQKHFDTKYSNEDCDEEHISEVEAPVFESDDYDDISAEESDGDDIYINEFDEEDHENLCGPESSIDVVKLYEIGNESIEEEEEEDEDDDNDEEDDDDEEEEEDLYLNSRDNCRICCAPLCYSIEEIDCEVSNGDSTKKRSFDEMEDDFDSEDSSDESSIDYYQESSLEPPRKKRLTPQSKWKSITKEIGKGLFYVLATLTALGIYGSTVTNDEN